METYHASLWKSASIIIAAPIWDRLGSSFTTSILSLFTAAPSSRVCLQNYVPVVRRVLVNL